MITFRQALAINVACLGLAPAFALSLIPMPQSIKENGGSFTLTPTTVITAEGDLAKLATYFAKELAPALGTTLTVAPKGAITLSLKEGLPAEGYTLDVTPSAIDLKASSPAGIFMGLQTLRQLMPVEAYAPTRQENVNWTIPCVSITDAPRFGWRGIMLDSSRHFQPKAEVLRFIDLMSHYKLNVFHWHLIDGHGWRMESKKFPRLTEIGAWRMQPDYPTKGKTERYGGYYTQDDIREIVAYAADRHITVVPEIEMPGHSAAALASYPELSCGGEGKCGVHYFYSYPCPRQAFPAGGQDVFCAGKEMTFYFLEEILKETMELFPSVYIHVGGDEVNKSQWANCPACKKRMKDENIEDLNGLQSYFIKRAERFLNSHGRKLIGWDEILEGGLPENAAVMSWRGIAGGIAAASQGKHIVMSPEYPMYLDRGQSKSPLHPPHWPGYVPIEATYAFNPVPQVLKDKNLSHLVMGVQGNLWTIFTHTQDLNDLQAYPRTCAIAEVGWSAEKKEPFEAFNKRLTVDKKRLDLIGVKYWKEPIIDTLSNWSATDKFTFNYGNKTIPTNGLIKDKGTYSISFNYTGGKHKLDIQSVSLLCDGKIIATDKHLGHTGSENYANTYTLKLDTYKPNAVYSFIASVRIDNRNPNGRSSTPDSKGNIIFWKSR